MRQLRAVDIARRHLVVEQWLARQRHPLVIGALCRICDHCVRVQLRLLIARDIVAEQRHCEVVGLMRIDVAAIALPMRGRMSLQPGHRCPYGGIVGFEDAGIAADLGRNRHRLWRREGQVPAGPMHPLPIVRRAKRCTVRKSTFEYFTKRRRINGIGQPQSCCAFTPPDPGARCRRAAIEFVVPIDARHFASAFFSRVVVVLLVVGDRSG